MRPSTCEDRADWIVSEKSHRLTRAGADRGIGAFGEVLKAGLCGVSNLVCRPLGGSARPLGTHKRSFAAMPKLLEELTLSSESRKLSVTVVYGLWNEPWGKRLFIVACPENKSKGIGGAS